MNATFVLIRQKCHTVCLKCRFQIESEYRVCLLSFEIWLSGSALTEKQRTGRTLQKFALSSK